jgi:DNA-3-methyladenine glycosylase I
MTYCEAILAGRLAEVHVRYHDTEYGFPLTGDAGLFERLILEISQAGLSWQTILRKRESFRAAYSGFDIDRVAAFTARDQKRLLNNPGVIRNQLKIVAAIDNAQRLRAIRKEHGSFRNWLDHHHPMELPDWVKLFRRQFRFAGGEIVREFLLSCGYLRGAHQESCPIFAKVAAANPPWMWEGAGGQPSPG